MSIFDESVAFWKTIKIEHIKNESGIVKTYTDLLREKYSNGSVIYNEFKLTPNYVSNNFDSTNIFRYLFKSELVRKDEIQSHFPAYTINTETNLNNEFHESHPYELPGVLGIILQNGGAYSKILDDMKFYEIGLETAKYLTNNDLNNGYFISSRSAWNSYFYDVAWDYTLIIHRPKDNFLAIMMATDTD